MCLRTLTTYLPLKMCAWLRQLKRVLHPKCRKHRLQFSQSWIQLIRPHIHLYSHSLLLQTKAYLRLDTTCLAFENKQMPGPYSYWPNLNRSRLDQNTSLDPITTSTVTKIVNCCYLANYCRCYNEHDILRLHVFLFILKILYVISMRVYEV